VFEVRILDHNGVFWEAPWAGAGSFSRSTSEKNLNYKGLEFAVEYTIYIRRMMSVPVVVLHF